MKKTFIHKFSNGDICTLCLDFTGKRGSAVTNWKHPDNGSRFEEIEEEYAQWRESVFRDFMGGFSFADQLEIAAKLQGGKA